MKAQNERENWPRKGTSQEELEAKRVWTYLDNVLGEHVPDLVQESVQRGQCCVVQGPLAQLVDQLWVPGMNGRDQDDPCLNGQCPIGAKRIDSQRWTERWWSEEG